MEIDRNDKPTFPFLKIILRSNSNALQGYSSFHPGLRYLLFDHLINKFPEGLWIFTDAADYSLCFVHCFFGQAPTTFRTIPGCRGHFLAETVRTNTRDKNRFLHFHILYSSDTHHGVLYINRREVHVLLDHAGTLAPADLTKDGFVHVLLRVMGQL